MKNLILAIFLTIFAGYSNAAYTPFAVSSQGTKNADIQSVYFGGNATCATACTTGNCTICNQVGSKITTVSFVSTGQYNINGIDGTKYNCVGGGVNPGVSYLHIIPSRSNSTSSYSRVLAGTGSGANVAEGVVHCIGKP